MNGDYRKGYGEGYEAGKRYARALIEAADRWAKDDCPSTHTHYTTVVCETCEDTLLAAVAAHVDPTPFETLRAGPTT